MIFNKEDIQQMDRVKRLKLINSVTGIKPANLLGSISSDGKTNVAIFSSVIHLGSHPALLGFIVRQRGDVPRHSYNNIIKNGEYTINHIHPDFIKRAHYTSGKFDESVSEFSRCGLTEEYLDGFKAPFVKESNFKMGMTFKEEIEIQSNGTSLIIGEVSRLIIPEEAFNANDINLEQTNSVGISGLNSYYSLQKIAEHPYVRVDEVPEFFQ
jgi:flavin reductase (DIM6/NTAB) family NADH-FMN oxidoreductase RutF